MKKIICTLTILWLLMLSCGRSPVELRKERPNETNESCLTKYPKDSADYKPIKCNFFIGKDGQLYKKKIAVDKFSPPYCDVVYFDKYLHKYYDDTIIDIPLSSIVDINSLICFDSSSYSKDNKRCYYYYDNSDGGFINIIDTADVASFQPLSTSWWAKDKKFVYYRGDIVKEADPASFRLLNKVNEEAQDKNHKFLAGKIIQ